MTPQIATSPEQSRRLLSCGVDPKTADMRIQEDMTGFRISVGEWHPGYVNLNMTPAWSLSTLLALLPNLIMADNRMQFTFRLIKCKDAYIVEYSGHNTSLYQSNGATTIEACVRMIETLTFHKHPLNKIEE